MSYAVFFGVLCAVCLVGALAALWGSLRAAFGGESGGGFAAGDTPERAALLDEKTALLRAIKDLQYEHQVGKLDQADFERLDRAYRARAKEVLELLDRDVRPFRARAEALLAAGAPPVPKKNKKKRPAEPEAEPVPETTDVAASEPRETETEAPAAGAEEKPADEKNDEKKDDLQGAIEALDPEKRAKAEAFLRQLASEAKGKPAGDDDDDEESDDEEEARP